MNLDLMFSSLFLMRWVALPAYLAPSLNTLVNVVIMYAVAGYYLSFFFLLSHNFADTQCHSPESNESFLYKQVTSSSNVGGPLLCWFNGGLNYQIEHHLFPRIHHSHYPKIAPVVREFCASKGIPYKHFDSIYANMVSTSKYLYNVARVPS
jgi:fatty acid desaturase (delta-4 desaturase)